MTARLLASIVALAILAPAIAHAGGDLGPAPPDVRNVPDDVGVPQVRVPDAPSPTAPAVPADAVDAGTGDASAYALAASTDGTAAALVAVSVNGDAHGELVAASVRGNATCTGFLVVCASVFGVASCSVGICADDLVEEPAPVGDDGVTTCGLTFFGSDFVRPFCADARTRGHASGGFAASADSAEASLIGASARGPASGWAAASVLGRASGGALAASGADDATGSLAASGAGDATAVYVAASGTGRATASGTGSFPFVPVFLPGVEASGAETLDLVGALPDDPWVRAVANVRREGDAEGGIVGVSSSGAARGCTVCVANGVGSSSEYSLVSVSTRGSASGTFAASGVGRADGDLAAVSARDEATANEMAVAGDGDARGNVVVANGDADGTIALATRDATAESVAVAGGDARCHYVWQTCAAVAGGAAVGRYAVSRGDAWGESIGASATGDAYGGTAAATLVGDAYGYATASVAGDSHGSLRVSVLGYAHGTGGCDLLRAFSVWGERPGDRVCATTDGI